MKFYCSLPFRIHDSSLIGISARGGVQAGTLHM